MTQYHEPTNEELWAQPPSAPAQPAPPVPAMRPQPSLQPMGQPPYPAEVNKPDRSRFTLAIVSLALGIPLTAIAAGTSGTFGLILSWVGIIAVNAVYALGGRHRP
jgi:hypothetical protein